MSFDSIGEAFNDLQREIRTIHRKVDIMADSLPGLNSAQAMAFLACGETKLTELRNSQVIAAVKIGSRWVYNLKSLIAYREGRK